MLLAHHLRITASTALVYCLSALLAACVSGECASTCGDLDADTSVTLADFDVFAGCLEQPLGGACECADLDGDGVGDMHDFARFAPLFGTFSDEMPPWCSGTVGVTSELTVYRPRHGAGYFPFARTAVADVDEDSSTLGPGIRVNAPGDNDPTGEDDLIEVVLAVDPPGALVALRRGNSALAVWSTSTKTPGSEIVFTGDRTDALPLGPTQSQMTLWVEWADSQHGVAELAVEPLTVALAKDTLTFHTFDGIVIALGGEGQVPSLPVDTNSGTFVAATDLYALGFDVHLFDEDVVAADGTGSAFDEADDAIANRGVSEVAIFGYSHGGGSTYSLADLLDFSRPGLPAFDITYTSYVDSVRNNSDVDVAQELRRPPGSLFHLNHYQHGNLFEDFLLDGGPVDNSSPPPTGLDVETTAWGANSTHFEIDDFAEVLDLLETTLLSRVTRRVSAATDGRDAWPPRRHAFAAPLSPRVERSADFAPDAAVQSLIAEFAAAETAAQQAAAADALAGVKLATPQMLLAQLVYYASRARDTRSAMAPGLLMRRLDYSDDVVAAAVVPLLDFDDAELRGTAQSVLGGLERRAVGRRPDFSIYRGLIAADLRIGVEPPAALVRYLYDSDAGEALLTMMRAHDTRDPAEMRELIWTEHVVAESLWKQRNGFLRRGEFEPAAARQLGRLATNDAWWVRLYVAEIMRQQPNLRDARTVEQLKHDRHALVREVMAACGPN